jgi:hypothetical protein
MLVSTIKHGGGGVQCSSRATHSAHAAQRRKAGQKLLRQIALRSKEAPQLDNQPVFKFLNHLDTVTVPNAWLSLARRCIAAERGRKQELRKALSPRLYPVPHIVSTAKSSCSLTGTASAQRFLNKAVNKFLADLFLAIPQAIEAENLPETTLSRYDLHHAHLFCSNEHGLGLGLLFHAKEYIFSESGGDIDVGNLGNCQIGTPLKFENEAMAWRNIIWYVYVVEISILSFIDFKESINNFAGWDLDKQHALM